MGRRPGALPALTAAPAPLSGAAAATAVLCAASCFPTAVHQLKRPRDVPVAAAGHCRNIEVSRFCCKFICTHNVFLMLNSAIEHMCASPSPHTVLEQHSALAHLGRARRRRPGRRRPRHLRRAAGMLGRCASAAAAAATAAPPPPLPPLPARFAFDRSERRMLHRLCYKNVKQGGWEQLKAGSQLPGQDAQW